MPQSVTSSPSGKEWAVAPASSSQDRDEIVVDAVSQFMVFVEADGPIPERYSMVAVGAVVVEARVTAHLLRSPAADLRAVHPYRPLGQRILACLHPVVPESG
jgi:hypothetical protein